MNKLREKRMESGLTQIELARAAGYDNAQLISNIEIGNIKPWPKLRRKLSEALQCSEDDIFPNNTKGDDCG